MDSQEKALLLEKAKDARKKAYAPYSKYFVGAAILTPEGEVFQGCNVENASYGLTNCAERTAVFKMVSEGKLQIKALAISLLGGQGFPCGACRQVLNEFNPQLPIFICDEEGNQTHETTLSELLPQAFGPQNLSSETP